MATAAAWLVLLAAARIALVGAPGGAITQTAFDGYYDMPYPGLNNDYTVWLAPSGAAAFTTVAVYLSTDDRVYASTCTAVGNCPDAWDLLNGATGFGRDYYFSSANSKVGYRPVVKIYIVTDGAGTSNIPVSLEWHATSVAAPTPSLTPPPTPSPTPSPTRAPTPSPTPSPTPNLTPAPTAAPTPSPTPSPAPCAPGTFNTATGTEPCSPCPAGTYSSALAGSTGCTACPGGKYSYADGSSSCAKCSSGSSTTPPAAAVTT